MQGEVDQGHLHAQGHGQQQHAIGITLLWHEPACIAMKLD